MENKVEKILANMSEVMVGKDEVAELTLITLLSEGHLLLEDVPGVGKTTLAKTFAKSISCQFGRIQFTPDTMPGDITGVSVYRMEDGQFHYLPGGIMNQIVLADEINRAMPKTQASLLEAMEEVQVSVDGKTYELPKPFMVIATQNPIEELGTYDLPEAQLDRFFMKISIGYPNVEQETEMLDRFLHKKDWKKTQSVVTAEEVLGMQKEVKQVRISKDLISYVLKIVTDTRENENLLLGASPRAGMAVLRAAQASAYCDARDYVLPDDVVKVLKPVLCHRLILSAEAKLNQITQVQVVSDICSRNVLPIAERMRWE